jgi:hypothetical protein
VTAKELAQFIDKTEYPVHLDKAVIAEAKRSGLVIVYGASDDLMEFDGAIYDDFPCYNGGTAKVDQLGFLPTWEDVCADREAARHYFLREPRMKTIEALWCKESGYAWTYKTDIPHETFEVMEGDDHYCRGIVFELKSLT